MKLLSLATFAVIQVAFVSANDTNATNPVGLSENFTASTPPRLNNASFPIENFNWSLPFGGVSADLLEAGVLESGVGGVSDAAMVLAKMEANEKSEKFQSIIGGLTSVGSVATAAMSGDTAGIISGVGDMISSIPGPITGLVGTGISIIGSLFGAGPKEDPVMKELHDGFERMSEELNENFEELQNSVAKVSEKVDVAIGKIDEVSSKVDIVLDKIDKTRDELIEKIGDATDEIVRKIDKEKLALITLTLNQMGIEINQYQNGQRDANEVAYMCRERQISDQFSALAGILHDDDLYDKPHKYDDAANAAARANILALYVSYIPIYTHCTSYFQNYEAMQDAGTEIHGKIETAHKRIEQLSRRPDLTIHVFEHWGNKFEQIIQINETKVGFRADEFDHHALSFPAYSRKGDLTDMQCYEITQNHFTIKSYEGAEEVCEKCFCVRKNKRGDAPIKIEYAERKNYHSGIFQPEEEGREGKQWHPLNRRGWRENQLTLWVEDFQLWEYNELRDTIEKK